MSQLRSFFVTTCIRLTVCTLLGFIIQFSSAPTAYAGSSSETIVGPKGERHALDAKFRRQIVRINSTYESGTIIVDSRLRHLYFILTNQKALRYGVGVAREGLEWSGMVKVGRKAKWPSWTPTANMIRRNPEYAKYASGMPGGPENPLGARAIYLYSEGQDTMYRIHGTSEPWTIGYAVSSGCIRMLNEDVIDLYDRVERGAKVVIR